MSIAHLLNQFDLTPSHTILDLGCGKGALVESLKCQGYDAYGCDIADSDASDYEENQAVKSYLRAIETQPYTLPFDDDQFDYVISDVVLEHVVDYESLFKEIHRVLKPGGVSLHVFPGRYVPIEPHVFVPLATILRGRVWLNLWAIIGIRNQFQSGKSAKEVAGLNFRYLNAHTNYPTNGTIIRHAHLFSVATFREDIFFAADLTRKRKPSLIRQLVFFARAGKMLAWWYRTFSMRLLFLIK